jgi:uncharacterized protein YbaP (TraB family)
VNRLKANLLVLLLALLSFPSLATDPPPATAGAGLHCLWKAEGKSNVVYLLGSIHVLKSADYPLPTQLEAACSNASIAVFETDLDRMETPEVQLALLNQSLLPPGESLSTVLSPATYAMFENHLHDAGFPGDIFDQTRPSVAALTLAVLEFQKLGFDPKYGLDQHFFARARNEHKQIIPLETVEFQINLATDFTREEGDLMMKRTLEDIDQTRKSFTDLLTAWQQGDAGKLEQLLNQARLEAPAIFKRLVTDRNRRWAPRIQDLLLGSQSAVVIVGAAHLVGPDGLVEILRQSGCKITQQ